MRARATRVALARSAPVAATYDAATHTISIWDTQAGDFLRSALRVGEIDALALGSRGEWLAIIDQQMDLAVLSTTSGEELARARLPGPRPAELRASGLTMAPDGRTIAVNRVTHVELWHSSIEVGAAGPDALRLEAVLLLPVRGDSSTAG